MLRSLPCVKSNAKATPGPTEIMDHQSLSFSSDLSAIVSESVEIIFVERGLPVIPFAQPSIFHLDDKRPGDRDGHERRLRCESRKARPRLIPEETEAGVTTGGYPSPPGPPSRLTDPSYVDMRPSPSYPSFSPRCEDYMKMDNIYSNRRSLHTEVLPSSLLTSSERRGSHIFDKLFKKGNRHKADYVFVDFERDNYMDMGRIPDKNWKFLTHFPRSKKHSC